MAMLAPPSASLSSCEALITAEEGRYYPLLRHAAVEAACAPESTASSDGAAKSDGAANATVLTLPLHAHCMSTACTLHVHAHCMCMHTACTRCMHAACTLHDIFR